MKRLPIALLPGIMKWISLQDHMTWLLVIFFSGATWNWKFLSPLQTIYRIYEIEIGWIRKSEGKIQVWYGMLLDAWKKMTGIWKYGICQECIENMCGMLNKNFQKQSPIGICQNSSSANMQQIHRRPHTRMCGFNKVAMQLLVQGQLGFYGCFVFIL